MSRRRLTVYPPSVGELVDRADVLARHLLYEAPGRDGRAMLRAWGEVVEGAGDLWRQLPRRSDFAGNGREVIDQLERSARTLHRSAGAAIEVDPTVLEIGHVFTQAAGLIASSGVHERREPARWTDAQLRDAFAARTSIMHTLYLVSHAVSVGLAQNALAERLDARLRVHRAPADELRHRVLGVEQVAHSYIRGNYPQSLHGRVREQLDHTRIPGAIASWDIHAQRGLVRAPTADTMAQVAGAAFAASTHAHRLWRAAVETGHIEPRVLENDVGPALEAMIEKWGEAHSVFQQLTHPHDTSPPPLRQACWELVDAMREVTRGASGPSSVADIAKRADMPSLLRSLHRFHPTIAGIAGAFHETARSTPLLIDARAAGSMLRSASSEDPWLRTADHAPVAPQDILHKRAVPLPDELRSRLVEVGHDLDLASRVSLRATLAATDRAEAGTSTSANGNRQLETASSHKYERRRIIADQLSVIVQSAPR